VTARAKEKENSDDQSAGRQGGTTALLTPFVSEYETSCTASAFKPAANGSEQQCVTVLLDNVVLFDADTEQFSFFHGRATTPLRSGLGAPVVVGNVIGRPRMERTARYAKACASDASASAGSTVLARSSAHGG
jgi:hypothetical protein